VPFAFVISPRGVEPTTAGPRALELGVGRCSPPSSVIWGVVPPRCWYELYGFREGDNPASSQCFEPLLTVTFFQKDLPAALVGREAGPSFIHIRTWPIPILKSHDSPSGQLPLPFATPDSVHSHNIQDKDLK
jgi:hypothetical protein